MLSECQANPCGSSGVSTERCTLSHAYNAPFAARLPLYVVARFGLSFADHPLWSLVRVYFLCFRPDRSRRCRGRR